MGENQPTSAYERDNEKGTDHGQLSQYVITLFRDFKNAREPYQLVWVECWSNFLGIYMDAYRWRQATEGQGWRSKVFIKLTALKCHTAHSKIVDAAFSGKSGNVPFDMIPYNIASLGLDPKEVTKAVDENKRIIKDHFKDIELQENFDTGILELAILGTSVIKGPIVEMREQSEIVPRSVGGVPNGTLSGDGAPTFEKVTTKKPTIVYDNIPLWEYYTDPNARSNKEAIGEIHFQRLLPAHLLKMAADGGYDKEAVRIAAERHTLRDESDTRYLELGDEMYMGTQGKKDGRVTVIEFWGLVPVELLRAAGCEKVPEDIEEGDSIEAVVVLAADGVVIKACVNPINRRPFNVCPYKKKPNSIYGDGVAFAMKDSQMMINSAARLTIDNKAISGSGVLGVNTSRIDTKRTKGLKLYPGKTFYTKGGFSPDEAIKGIVFPDVTHGLLELIELFERFADEETGLPKYTSGSGEQGSFLNKTAAGMSMLMTAANVNLKTVMVNIDDYWIEPIVEATYEWMMAFNESFIKLPLKIQAQGTDSLIAKELKMENLMKALQVTSAPQDAIFLNRPKLMKQIFDILETEDVLRSEEEVDAILKKVAEEGEKDDSLKQSVGLDKLYPMLTRFEQIQVVEAMGITPDIQQSKPMLPPPPPAGGRDSAGGGGPSKKKGGDGKEAPVQ